MKSGSCPPAQKFIFISGHAEKVIEDEGIIVTDTEQGEMIMKPILPFELLKKIREMLAPSVDFSGSH